MYMGDSINWQHFYSFLNNIHRQTHTIYKNILNSNFYTQIESISINRNLQHFICIILSVCMADITISLLNKLLANWLILLFNWQHFITTTPISIEATRLSNYRNGQLLYKNFTIKRCNAIEQNWTDRLL